MREFEQTDEQSCGQDQLQEKTQRLAQERANLQDIFEAVPVALLLIDENVEIVRLNNVATRMVRREAAEMLAKRPGDGLCCIHAQSVPEGCGHAPACRECSIRGTVEQVLRNGEAVRDVEVEQRLMPGNEERYFWFSINATSLALEGKRYVLLAINDITGRKASEMEMVESKKELEETARRLDFILQATRTGFDIIDADFNLLYVDPQWQNVYGNPAGRKCYDYFKGRKEACAACGIPQALQTKAVTVKEQVLPREGNRVVEVHSIPFQDEEGKWLVAEFKIDITERKQIEEELREREQKLDKIITAAQDAIIIMDPRGIISMWNDSAGRIFGYTAAEAIGQDLHKLLAPARYHEAHLKAFSRFCSSGIGEAVGQVLELTALRKGGEEFPVELSLSAVYLKSGWHAVGVLRDITERKHAEAALQETNLQLAEAKEKAEAANRAKSEFLANMSHEIRTPMNVIIGMSDLLCNSDLNEEQREFAGMVKDSADSLLTIINDILDFSKVEAGRLEMESTAFNVRSLVEKTVSPLALRAHAKELELLYDMDESVPQVLLGDPNRLRQILINLLGNAIKFTDRGEVVLTVTTEEGSRLRFSVRDTGPGIPEDKQGLLFQSFSQVDSSSTRRHGGTGLGLAISKKLVELMGGTIGLASRAGEGSTFTFSIPMVLPQAGDSSPEEEPIPIIAELKNLNVLVIDDNSANRIIMEKMLTSWGINVTTASGGEKGLGILQNAAQQGRPFDLILLDQQMPGMDGFQVAEQVRSNEGIQSVLMMMLTSVDMQNSISCCHETGLDDYMVKPIKQSDLLNRIYFLFHKKQPLPQASPPEASRGINTTRPLNILLVEDKPMNRKLATVLLEKKGWKVTPAHNGRHALEILASASFDLILMDVQMPEMDGLEATRRIRKKETENGGHIPIIAMTAHAMQGDREKCLEAGMDNYVSKPINPEELYLAVEGATAFKEQQGLFSEGGAMLKNLGGDKELLAEMAALLLEDGARDLKQLRELLAARDMENSALVAHGLKGELGNLGMEDAYRTARNLEKSIKKNKLGEAAQYLQGLEEVFKDLENFFTRPDWREML